MPSTCVVPCCSDRSGGHKFPRDKALREKWIVAIRRVNFQPSEHSKVCKKHFRKEDYKLPKDSTSKYPVQVLKKDAVPSRFSWNENNHQVHKEYKKEKKLISGQRCSVLQCKSGSSKNITLHSCPNQEAVRKKWAEVFKVNREVIKSMLICSQHFLMTDYLSSENGDSRTLKQNAVPSQKLPRSTRIVSLRNKVLQPKKKLIRSKQAKKIEKMSEAEDEDTSVSKQPTEVECRACLRKVERNNSVCNIFQIWVPAWAGMGATIAEDLAKVANVEVKETDNYPKIICQPCYCKLLDASMFAANVRNTDEILRLRQSQLNCENKAWPKPIQVDKNINSTVFQDMDIEIKQEAVSEDEYGPNATENSYIPENNMDIKIEPEELIEPQPLLEPRSSLEQLPSLEPQSLLEPQPYISPPFVQTSPFEESPPPLTIMINGTRSLQNTNPENMTLLNEMSEYDAIITDPMKSSNLPNGTEDYNDQNNPEDTVKEEPLSEDEGEQYPDLSLECLLCTKGFNSVSGLKAHVIAQHSYKSVKRKTDNATSPEKKIIDEYCCQICRRTFVTSTDLMVHETCHNKHSCYGCSRKFDTFKQLSKHRKRCNLPLNKTVAKPKTLDDVMRPVKQDPSTLRTEPKTEEYSNNNKIKSYNEDASSVKEIPTIKTEIEDPEYEINAHNILKEEFT